MSGSGSKRSAQSSEEVSGTVVPIRPDLASSDAHSRPPLFRPGLPPLVESGDQMDLRVSEELDFVIRQLEQLRSSLAQDAVVVQRHRYELQSMGLLDQTLGHLSRVVRAQDKAAAAERVSTADLRSRLMRSKITPILSKH